MPLHKKSNFFRTSFGSFTWAGFWLLCCIVARQLCEVGSSIAVAAHIAYIDLVAEPVSQQRGLPVDERVSNVRLGGKVDSAATSECESIVANLHVKNLATFYYKHGCFNCLVIQSMPIFYCLFLSM